jgi:hypothetical protein
VVGAGLEYGFAPNWSAAVEYDHIFQDGRSSTFTSPAGVVTGTFRDSSDTDLVTARIAEGNRQSRIWMRFGSDRFRGVRKSLWRGRIPLRETR